jgi:putative transposon-encoded protein
MKIFTKSIIFVLSLTALFMTFGAIISNAQDKDAKISKNITAQIVSRKKANAPFVLLTPNDLANRSTTETTNGGDPCDFAVSAAIGQTHGGALNNTDCQLDDNSYADFYTFQGNQGQQVTITMNSSQIDSYLGLANMSGTFTMEDDDSGGGWTARIIATLPETGTYVILANSASPNEFGGYTLTIGGAAPCTFSASPASFEAPAAGGTFTFEVITQAQCHWQAFPLNNFTTTSSTGIGPGTVTYTVSQNGSGQTRTGSVIISTSPLITTYNSFLISQPSVSCSYSINPSSVNLSSAAANGSFQLTAPAGCPWTVQTNDGFINASGSGTGSATINYSTSQNNGEARVGTIQVGGQTFTINQAGLGCTFNITPTQMSVPRLESVRTITINTQPGCPWSAGTNVNHIQLFNNSGTGAGTITFKVQALTDTQWRSGVVQIFHNFNTTNVWVDQDAHITTPAFDFDADGKSDISIFRPSVGEWWYQKSSNGGNAAFQFGNSADKIVPRDYTGDGKTDVAVFRPSTGEWFILRSEDSSYYSFPFGIAGDVPVPVDFDSDGKADAAVFRPSDSTWYINKSSGGTAIQQFGVGGDVPVAADYDRDGKADIAIFRPSTGEWWLQRTAFGTVVFQFGNSSDKPVPADYTGDTAADVAIFRPSTGEWFILRSENNSYYSFPFGASNDIPAPGDYDGDGRSDAAVFRPSDSTWYVQRTTAGTLIQTFGIAGDKPVPNAFVP